MASETSPQHIDYLKTILRTAWQRVDQLTPGESVYAFGFLTTEWADFMFPFACGELGLKKVAERYLTTTKMYQSLGEAVAGLRWSFADSPYNNVLDQEARRVKPAFADRPKIYDLPETEAAREIDYRLMTACAAIQSLDKDSFFGTGTDREKIVLLIDGGDCTPEWILKWAKELNPAGIYQEFARALTAE